MVETRPDIVMVMTDQHAARIMGCAGDSFAQTPVLDALAKQGVRFDSAYCNAPLCVPSRMSFLTGLEPHETGVLNNDTYLPSDIPTIAHALGAAGYDCHLVGRMHFNGPDQQHGFAHRPIGDIGASYPGGTPPDIGPLTKGRGNRGPELTFSGAGETSYQAYDKTVIQQAEQTLEHLIEQREQTGRPFFVLISLFCPHPPYISRRDDFDIFENTLPQPRLSPPENAHPVIDAWRKAGGADTISEADQATSRAAYYGLVRMIDQLCGRIFDRVKDRQNTVSIYTSDHGECLGERGLWWKSVMYDQSAKVPLIIRAPDKNAGNTDERISSLLDLSTTILDYAGVAPLPGTKGKTLREPADPNSICLSSYYGGLMNIALPDVRHRMIRKGRYKLMWFDGHAPMLFDLETDPDELTDLAPDPNFETDLNHLTQLLMQGWSPDAIRVAQAQKKQQSDVIRAWVKTTNPPEPFRWFDPEKARNKYE